MNWPTDRSFIRELCAGIGGTGGISNILDPSNAYVFLKGKLISIPIRIKMYEEDKKSLAEYNQWVISVAGGDTLLFKNFIQYSRGMKWEGVISQKIPENPIPMMIYYIKRQNKKILCSVPMWLCDYESKQLMEIFTQVIFAKAKVKL